MALKPTHVTRCKRGAAKFNFVAALFLLIATTVLSIAAVSNPPGGTILPTSSPLNWTGTALGGASLDESTCIEGVNCDTFTLNVGGLQSAWAGKVINIEVSWTNNLNDYDLYIHKDSLTGPLVGNSGGGFPGMNEAAAISPSIHGTGIYVVHVVYFLVAPQVDQYRAKASVGTNTAMYVKGGMSFSPNQALVCPVAAADAEPSSRCDMQGNYYISGIRGVPAGCDLWHVDLNPLSATFDPFMRNATYRGQPDSFTQDEAYILGADGGGDVDLAVGHAPDGPNNVPTLAFVSLVAGNISSAVSKDRGETWTLNPIGNVTGGIPVDDRQWIEFLNKDVVYLIYRTLQPAITQIQRSNDGGLTWGPARTVGQLGQVGCVDVDKNDGTVYLSGSSGFVGVGVPAAPGEEPLLYNSYPVANDANGIANIFFVVKVADDGTVYATWSNGQNVYVKRSTNKGQTWSPAFRVNDGPETKTAIFPWLETGPTPGSIAVAWLGSPSDGNTADANWHVFAAQCLNAKDPVPTFRQAQVSDHVIHAKIVSTGGTLGDQNRNILDYFQICFDPQGALVVGYSDDHNDYSGHTFVSRQISGPNNQGKKMKKQKEGSALPPAEPFSTDGSQVVDFANDVALGLLVVAPVDTSASFDVRSIKYSSEIDSAGDLNVVATMKVGSLSQLFTQTNWRMMFAANAPGTGVNASGQYSNGVSDRGDMFYLRCGLTVDLVPVFTWGTVARDVGGGMVYTQQGTADAGSMDVANGTITVKVKANRLGSFCVNGPPVGPGTVLCGLRGEAFGPLTGLAASDITRGGLEYTIP